WDYEGTTLALYAEHRLTLSQLFAQHNESHLALARVIGLLSAPLTGWDMRYEVALTAGCAIFLAVGLNILICRTPSLSRLQVLSAVAVTDFAVLACTQFEVLLFGAYYFIMPSLTLVWALVLTGRPDRPTSATRLLIVYIAASIIATLSYINGIFHWFCSLPWPWPLRVANARILLGLSTVASAFWWYLSILRHSRTHLITRRQCPCHSSRPS